MQEFTLSWEESGAPWGQILALTPEAALAAAQMETRKAGECPDCLVAKGPRPICPPGGEHMGLVVVGAAPAPSPAVAGWLAAAAAGEANARAAGLAEERDLGASPRATYSAPPPPNLPALEAAAAALEDGTRAALLAAFARVAAARPAPGRERALDALEEALEALAAAAGEEVTDEQVEGLLVEAGAAGDQDQARLCRAALAGDGAARRACAGAIAQAAAAAAEEVEE